MKNLVAYNEGSAQVKDPRKDNVVVYAHPGDKISLDFDISALKKEVINGDLVIRTQSGGTVTIANYAIMYMQNQFPMIIDSLSQEYGYYDFLNGVKASTSSDNPDSVIIDRIVSTPKAGVNSGDYLATGREFLVDDSAIKELVGMIDVEEQHPILANDVFMNPYVILTLYPEGTAKYDVPVTFRYAGRTILNQEEPSTLPVVTRVSNPKSAPIYGTKQEFFTPGEGITQGNEIRSYAGGGDKKGNDYSDYMFKPEHLDYSSQSSSIYYKAYSGNQIIRGLNLYLTDSNTIFQSIILQDVPDGVTFISTETTEVQPLGNGSFLITPKSSGNSIDLYFTYYEANALDSFGNSIGMEEIMSQIRISIEGYNSKYEQLVIGSTEITFDFREVHSENDVNNFSLYNTYTYSTLFDPLIVTLSRFSDYVKGGVTNHIYELLEGDDIFWGGPGDETVYMGEGNDTYYYNFGNDKADGKANMDNVGNPQITGVDVLRFDHDAYVNKNGTYIFNVDVNISFSNGDIKVFNKAINPRGVADNSTSSFTNFDQIYLEEDSGISANTDNSVEIGDTSGFRGLEIFSGGGNDTLVLTMSSLLDFTDVGGASVTSSVARNNARSADDFNRDQKIYFAPLGRSDQDRFTTIRGSNGNDYFLASDSKDYDLFFDGRNGTDTIDFSSVVGGVSYYVSNGLAIYGSSNDTLVNINVFIGTAADDTIYGSGTGSLIIYGINEDDAGGANDIDTVTYEEFTGISNKGVEINYVVGKDKGTIVVDKYGRGKDTLYYIDIVKASQADDIFILAINDSYTIDGLDGTDLIDYSQDIVSTGITVNVTNVTEDGSSGTVDKGPNTDNFSNINGVIGTTSDDTFLITGSQEGNMTYDGKKGHNIIDYSGTSDVRINYNLSKDRLEKMIISTNKSFLDIVSNVSELIGTDEDDQFIAEDNAWETATDIVYNAGASHYDPIKDITEDTNGNLVNAGDVLFLNYDLGNLNLSLMETIFKNFNTLRLGNYNNVIEYGDTAFSAFWGSTSTTTKDTFSAAKSSSAVIYEITGNLATINSLKLYNFDVLKGSDAGTTFKVTLDPTKLNINYEFIGGQSLQDILDYSGTDASLNLEFDLGSAGENDSGFVVKGDSANRDTFSNIENFVGGQGDDIFYLNPFNTNYAIDGSGGINTVSFKNYTNAVSDADINYSLFTNIQAFELTNLDDSWLISSTAEDSRVSGGAGTDTLNIDARITGLTYNIDTNVILNILGPNPSEHTLSHFEILYGTDNSHTTATDEVTMKAVDNGHLAEKNTLYFVLNNGIVDYSSLTSGVILDIYTSSITEVGVPSNMQISKGTGSLDYYSGVKNITLTDEDDTIKLDLADPSSFENIIIDAGGGEDTLDLSGSSTAVIYDSTAGTLNGITFKITNWEIMRTGDGDDEFKLSTSDRDLIINSGLGDNTLDLSNFSEDLTVDFGENSDRVEASVNSGKIVETTGIKRIIGGSSKNIFNGSTSGNYYMDGGVSTNSILDYSSSSDPAGFSFYLSDDLNTTISKGSSGNYDTIRNIQTMIGTKQDDVFTIVSNTAITSVDGGIGRDELLVELPVGATIGFDFNLDTNILTGGGLANPIAIFNFEVLNGSTFSDTFTVTNESVLDLKGEIRGNGGNNTLNAKIVDGSGVAVDLYLDLSRGFIYKKSADNTPSPDSYMSIENIKTVNLGDGNDIFVFTGNLPAGSYTVNLGAGDNLLSFKEINYFLSGTYQQMIDQVVGSGSPVTILGDYGLQLTQYSDYLEIPQGEANLVVDGFGGNDTADYNAVTNNMTIDFTTATNNTIVIERGTNSDTLINFEKFILGSGNNSVLAGGVASINIDGGIGATTISYEKLEGGIIAQLDKGTVLKNQHNTADLISNFDVFKDSKGDDIIYASIDYTEIWGNEGSDILNLSRVTATKTDVITYGFTGTALNDRFVTVTGAGAGNFQIKTTNGGALGREHTYQTIIFGNYDVVVKTNTIEGRTYSARSGYTNELNYDAIVAAEGGIVADFASRTVSSNGSGTNVDTFSYFSVITGTNNGDIFTGLSSSSKITINAGSGDDTVSFTGSASALKADIKADGTIDTGSNGVVVNKTVGNLVIGGTRHDDTFYITDMNVFNVDRGVNGEGGTNTLDFSKLTSGLGGSFDIGATRTYQTLNMQRYVFTSQNDTIIWAAGGTNLDVKIIDLGTGNDEFQVGLDAIAGAGTNVIYQMDGDNASLSINSTSFNKNLSLVNLEKLVLSAGGGSIDSFKAIFKGGDYTSGNIFGDQIELNNISFTNGVFFEYRDYKLPLFNTNSIIANVTDLSFLGSSDGVTMNVTVADSTAQAKDINIKIYDVVNMTIDASITSAADIILDEKFLRVATSTTHNQIFSLAKISDSTVNLNNQTLQVVANTTVIMPKVTNISYSATGSGIDFSGYTGQHGNASTGVDWIFSAGKLTGRLANSFEVNFNRSVEIDSILKLTATNDVFSISVDRGNLASWVAYDGAGGTNTVILSEGNDIFIGITDLIGYSNRIWFASENLDAKFAGSNVLADYGDGRISNNKRASNFSIFDARADGINKDMTNDTIINVVLSPDSDWTYIYMPYAKNAVASQDNMQRTILNAAGYDAKGTNPVGGFGEGGTYTVSFEEDPDNLGQMNRMMQVEARLKDTPTSTEKIFNVGNVQSIYGKKGMQDHFIFNTINTDQFEDLISQLSQGNKVVAGSNDSNVANRKTYLYIDTDFAKDETGTTGNNIAANPGSIDKYDIIDFSSWRINNASRAYDIELSGLRGDAVDNGLHLLGLGRYEDNGTNAMIMMKASGYQKIVLPETKFYFSLSTSYFARAFVLEFPDVKDSSLYGTFDHANGNILIATSSLFQDASGTSFFTKSATTLTFINFTTFFLALTNTNAGATITTVIGENFATEGLFNSNNVHLYYNQNQGGKPTSSRSNNADAITGSKSNDAADFSAIDSGVYYYSRGAWVDREHKSHDFVSTNSNTNRQATSDYEAFLTDTNTGVGVIFTNYYDKGKIGTTDGLSRDVGAFYRMQGVNILTLTNASNTFALGEIYWSNTVGTGPVGALVNADSKTFLKTVNGGLRVDTLLDNTFTADTRASGGGLQYGNVQKALGKEASAYNFFYYLGDNGVENGHMERFYTFDAQASNILNLRAVGEIDATYGAIRLGSDLASTAPNTQGTYTAEFGRATYNNFEKVIIDDYSADGMTINGYYKGVQDNLSVRANVETGTNIGKYREFDLGGRYFSNEASRTVESQKVLHESFGNQIRLQFTNSVDKKVDSDVIIADGYNGSNYTSYYGYKNWDVMEFGGKGGSHAGKQISIVFNTDFDFDKMDGKSFKINVLHTMDTTVIKVLFQESIYNYKVILQGGIVNKYQITSEDGSQSFNLEVDFSIATFDYKLDATASDIGSSLTREQIDNLEKYGNLEGIDYGNDNQFLENSSDDGSAGVGSYGRSTLNDTEEDQSEYIAYTDGSSGMTSFGRGSRSESSKTLTEENGNKQESKEEEQQSQLPPEEEQWFTDSSEDELDNNYADDTLKEEEEQTDNDEDLENQIDSDNVDDNLQGDSISFLDQYYNDLNQENVLDNVDFTDFVEKHNDFNMDDLFDKSENLLSNNIELSNSLGEMIETINSIEEEAVNVTNQIDELDSMSFALDSMFTVDENTGNTEVGVDNNNKNKNTNNFSNS